MNNKHIDLEQYFPFYFCTIANRWTAASSRTYFKEFEVGIGEWRVLAAMFMLGKVRSNDIVNFGLMDPGAVSRVIKSLERKNLIRLV